MFFCLYVCLSVYLSLCLPSRVLVFLSDVRLHESPIISLCCGVLSMMCWISVILPETTNCRVARAAKLTQVHGFLSNLVTAETGCGSVVSPWLIEAKSGQRVNVTLWNFAMDKAGDLARSLGANSCLKYAILTETDKKHHKVVCGDFSRISHVYTSVGSSLDVRIQGLPSSSSTGPYFLLEYQSMFNPCRKDDSLWSFWTYRLRVWLSLCSMFLEDLVTV